MAIYDLFTPKERVSTDSFPLDDQKEIKVESSRVNEADIGSRGQFFSSLAARLFFLLLFAADLLWFVYTVLLFLFGGMLFCLSLGRSSYFKKVSKNRWISCRRSLVCGVSLLIALFSPALGIMLACTYFLMYDKSGIEEVVPSSLQAQFKEFFPKE